MEAPESPQQLLSMSSSPPRPHGKSLTKKSFVWKYFHHPMDDLGSFDFKKTVCSICNAVLAFNNSGTTTTMLNHLKSRHGDVAKNEEDHKKGGRASAAPSVSPSAESPREKSKEAAREEGKVKTPSAKPQRLQQEVKASRESGSPEFDKLSLLAAQNAAAAMSPFLNPFLNPASSEFPFAALGGFFPGSEAAPYYPYNLKNHMRQALHFQQHGEEPPEPSGPSQAKRMKRKSQAPLRKPDPAPGRGDGEEVKKELVQFLAKDLVEVGSVLKPGFQGFLRFLDPKLQLPSKQEILDEALKPLCAQRLLETKATVRSLQTNPCLTLETWSSSGESWVTISVRYEDPHSHKFVTRALRVSKVSAPVDLAVLLLEVIADVLDVTALALLPVVTNSPDELTAQLQEVKSSPDMKDTGPVLDRIRVLPCLLRGLEEAVDAVAELEALPLLKEDLNSNLTATGSPREAVLASTGLKEVLKKLQEDSSLNCISAVFPVISKMRSLLSEGSDIQMKLLEELEHRFLSDEALKKLLMTSAFLNPEFKASLMPEDVEEVQGFLLAEVKERMGCADLNRRKRNSIIAQQSAEALKMSLSDELQLFDDRCTSNLSLEAKDFRGWWAPCSSLLPNLLQVAKKFFAVPAMCVSNVQRLEDFQERRDKLPELEKSSLLVLHSHYCQ